MPSDDDDRPMAFPLHMYAPSQQNKRSMIHDITNDYFSQSLRLLFAGTAQINGFISQGAIGILLQIVLRSCVSCIAFQAGGQNQLPFKFQL